MKIFYKIYHFVLKIYTKIKFNPKIYGINNIPSKGKLIIISNHKSNYDFLAMGLIAKRPIHFVVKSSLYRGILSLILKSIEAIPVDRSKKNPETIKLATNYLKKDEIIGIFPEGTINKTSKLTMDFKIGAIKMAYETNSPILPIAILGKYQKNRLYIKIDKPFYVESTNLTAENERLRMRLEENLRGIR